jgi:ribosomal protein S18 acetylase RimI-like enzyme
LGLRLYVEKNNSAAQRAYEHLGMTNNHYDLFEDLF